MPDRAPEKGLLSFIKMKLQSSVAPEDIKRMLLRAGFPESHIDAAFDHVRKIHADTHQDLAASNDFLPKLSKKDNPSETQRAVSSVAGSSSDQPVHAEHKGLFAGRLRRKDFVMGFLFFFGVGYVTLAFSALALSVISPDLWHSIMGMIESDENNLLIMLVPVLLAPITIMMMSLIVRRLHNLGITGGVSLIFLVWFLPSFGEVWQYGLDALEIALGILFVVLVTVKGHPAPNKYGPLPGSRGSFFRRIFNI